MNKNIRYKLIYVIAIFIALSCVLYLTRDATISSCTPLAGKASRSLNDFPGEAMPAGEPCPVPTEASTGINPPGSSTNQGSSSSSSSSGKSKSSNQGPIAENQSNQTLELSPEVPENKSAIFPQELINQFIKDNQLNEFCTISNKSISEGLWQATIEGNRQAKILWINIRVPIQARLIVSQDEIQLSCINMPWWAHFILR